MKIPKTVGPLIKVTYKMNNGVSTTRMVRPRTVLPLPCPECGYPDYKYAKDQDTVVCLDCFSVKEENWIP